MLRAALYFHTIRHLQPAQIFGRLRFRLTTPSVPSRPAPPVAVRRGQWCAGPSRPASLLGSQSFRLLNKERELQFPQGWNLGEVEKLWLYNLHYFDDLVAERAETRNEWQEALVKAWIRDNGPAAGIGWDPYPISRRVVNWIKWTLRRGALDSTVLASLATQLRYLSRRVEWHIGANHLLVNGKALLFGGCFFSGPEADAWLAQGVGILDTTLDEQILADGGHYERSPMYHALVLEDLLDIASLLRAFPERERTLPERVRDIVPKMLGWLETMCHMDGDIAFFNDSALGVAASAQGLRDYAHRLGLAAGTAGVCGARDLAQSGYARLREGDWCVLFDAAPLGPDHQPGHGHADTLSFELSAAGERIICNGGTSTYEPGSQRTYERSTVAHNTVQIGGENSSEVWASFRVARRAKPIDRKVDLGGGRQLATCAHDGYRRLPGAPLHRRSLEATIAAVKWFDRVEGEGNHTARGFIPLHPDVQVIIRGDKAELRAPSGKRYILTAQGVEQLSAGSGTFASQFGLVRKRTVIEWGKSESCPFEVGFELRRA